MSVPWVPRARSDAYWEKQICEEAHAGENAEASESTAAAKRPTMVDHSRGLRTAAAPPADHGE